MPPRRPGLLAFALVLLLATIPRPAPADDAPALSPAEARLRADVAYLADDLREGRAPGTPGIEAAADYIAGVFRELGLRPAPGADGYFQHFSVKGSTALGPDPTMAFRVKDETIALDPKGGFAPLSLGSGASVGDLPVVFAGFGVTARDEKAGLDYDDYAGVDVEGKAVLILRKEPGGADDKGPFDGKGLTKHADLRLKATTAFQHGAKAILLVNDAETAKERDSLLPIGYAGGDQSTTIPYAMIPREQADKLLKAAGMPDLARLESEINADYKPRSRPIEGVTLSAKYEIERKQVRTKNVVAVLEGSGPLADETIVVGGHYDHLGHGGLMSGSLAFLSTDIHNGADDNASGTAMVLEMARRLARRPDPLPRRVVFMAFSGEEKGLLGSMHYVNNPLYPIDKTVFMINFDMVGRLNASDELTMFGVGSTPGAGDLVDALGASLGFKIKKVTGMSDGIGGSDHQSFYTKGVPVLFAFTGTHKDYHRPSDDTPAINVKGMARIADLGELLLLDLTRRPTRPEFTRSAPRVAAHGAPSGRSVVRTRDGAGGEGREAKKAESSPHGDAKDAHGDDAPRVSISAYLGSIPDYDDSAKGVKLSGVSDGSPAEKGGLKGGDVVIGFAGKPVATIYDYTNSLAAAKPGETVEVKVRRDGKDVTLKVTLGSRPRGN